MTGQFEAIRIKYGKVGPGRYISHLDTIRAVERAIRRMGLPVLYSEGFSPRPKMTFAAALQVGVGSVAEHMDVLLERGIEPADVLCMASSAFPETMPLIAAGRFGGGYALPAKVRRARYLIKPFCRDEAGWSCGSLQDAIEAFKATPSVTVLGKDGKEKDVKGLVYAVRAVDGALEVEVACGDKNLRPQYFVDALSAVSGGLYSGAYDFCRTGLFIDLGRGLQDPMDDCADTAFSEVFRS